MFFSSALIRFAWIGLFCFTAEASTRTLTCREAAAIIAVSHKVDLPLEPNEFVVHPNHVYFLADPKRVVLGTATANKEGVVTGGRLFGLDIDQNRIFMNLEVPGSPDTGPVGVNKVAFAPSGKFIAGAGGPILGGPHIVYNIDLEKVVRSGWETFDPLERLTTLIYRDLESAFQGDQRAANRLASFGYNPLFLEMEVDSKQLQGAAKEKFYEKLKETARKLAVSLAEELEEAPAVRAGTAGMDFSPDGGLFLSDNGNVVTIHDIKKRKVVQRIPLDLNLTDTLPPGGLSRFFDGGRHVISFHREGFMALWNIEHNAPSNPVKLDFEVDFRHLRPLTISPSADYLAISGVVGEEAVTEIWTTQPGEYSTELIRVKRFSRRNIHSEMDHVRYIPVAFDAAGNYLVGNADGTAVLYDMNTHLPLTKFKSLSAAPVDQVFIAPDSSAAATVIEDGKMIAVWPLQGEGRAQLLSLPNEQRVYGVQFASTANEMLVEAKSWKPKTQRLHLYVINTEEVFNLPEN